MDTHNDLVARRKATLQKYYQKNKEKLKLWREAHKQEKRKYDSQYCDVNAETIRIQKRAKLLSLKEEVFSHYDSKCECCQEKQMDFLIIDHIYGGGEQERKKNGLWGKKMYLWLKKNNYPAGFRVLCQNCNWSAHLHGGTCVHKINLKTYD